MQITSPNGARLECNQLAMEGFTVQTDSCDNFVTITMNEVIMVNISIKHHEMHGLHYLYSEAFILNAHSISEFLIKVQRFTSLRKYLCLETKVQGANMGPTWVLSAPDGPHVGPMNLVMICSNMPRTTTHLYPCTLRHHHSTGMHTSW